jgi:hypothetical protein
MPPGQQSFRFPMKVPGALLFRVARMMATASLRRCRRHCEPRVSGVKQSTRQHGACRWIELAMTSFSIAAIPSRAPSFTSPVGRGRRAAPGEGVRTIDRYYPLTPTLSPWEREELPHPVKPEWSERLRKNSAHYSQRSPPVVAPEARRAVRGPLALQLGKAFAVRPIGPGSPLRFVRGDECGGGQTPFTNAAAFRPISNALPEPETHAS